MRTPPLQTCGSEKTRWRRRRALFRRWTSCLAVRPTVDPAAGGSVDAWAGKYGTRGSLKNFFLASLEAAAPSPLAASALMAGAVDVFGLQQETKAERDTFRRRIRMRLREVPHLVEELPPQAPAGQVLWRRRSMPRLAQIAAEVSGDEQLSATAHAIRSEVGG
jgi:hypothetical protein